MRAEALWAYFRFQEQPEVPYGGRSDLRRWAVSSISAGQEDKAVEQTESLEGVGRGSPSQNPPFLPRPPMDGAGALNLSREDG